MWVRRISFGAAPARPASRRRRFSASYDATSTRSGAPSPTRYWFVPGPVMTPGFGARTTRGGGTVGTLATSHAIAKDAARSYTTRMGGWRRVSLVGRNGALRAPGQLVE